jgi:protein involved in polysaccharide export with SLBB domain
MNDALLKLIYVLLLVAVLSVCGAAQTATDPLNPLSPGQLPDSQQPGQTQLPVGQLPPTLPQLRSEPTTITNVSPAQEAADRQREAQRQRDSITPLHPLPAEPDTEFQEFVAASLGEHLPIFGQKLFDNVPSTFAPLDRVQVTPEYIIGPGDELVIRAWGQINVDYRQTVDRSGSLYIPKVGSFTVAGVKYGDLHDYLNAEISRVFKNFQLSVVLGSLRSIQIFVVGQVRRPGAYTVSSLSTLVDAILASGGPSKHGSMRRIDVKRNGEVATTFDFYDLLVNGDKTKDIKLLPGDVIYVPPVGPLVALAGSVNNPGIYEVKDKSTLREVLTYAGGVTNTVAAERIVVERIDEQHQRRAEHFSFSQEGFDRTLHDGDVVRFLQISPKFQDAVTLRGNVAIPGRYPWHPGMRLHDLIPSRASLVTEDYWRKQNQVSVSARNPESRIGQAEIKNDVRRISTEINWDYAVIQRLNPQDLSSHLLPFNLGKLLDGDATQNLPLEPADVITIFSQADLQVPIARQSKFVNIEGEFERPGVYQVAQGETLRQLIKRVGGLTSHAYLYGSEFTRQSTREIQQKRLDEYVNSLDRSIATNTAAIAAGGDTAEAALSKAQDQNLVQRMRGLKATGRIVLELRPNAIGEDALPDLVLEDGDRLVVPFRPATVNIIGSVYNSNAFIYKPGKSVGDYLRIAGGATRDGDKSREFVIRADGSTVSRQQHSSLISASFDSLRLMPGDTVVVPAKINRGATLRALRDYSVIFGQLGLAAGGIRALFP